jgi:hypothetical protein
MVVAGIDVVHHTSMIAGNRRAGEFVIVLVLNLFFLCLLAVLLTHWKTRQPVSQKSISRMFCPMLGQAGRSAAESNRAPIS